MSAPQALEYIRDHGMVLERARGPLPNLVDAIVGEPVGGSWWGHPKARAIYAVLDAVRDDPEVLACRLVNGRVTLVHKRMWAAFVRLAEEGLVPKARARLAALREEHTPEGRHATRTQPFPDWVPPDVMKLSEVMDVEVAKLAVGGAAGLLILRMAGSGDAPD